MVKICRKFFSCIKLSHCAEKVAEGIWYNIYYLKVISQTFLSYSFPKKFGKFKGSISERVIRPEVLLLEQGFPENFKNWYLTPWSLPLSTQWRKKYKPHFIGRNFCLKAAIKIPLEIVAFR